VGAHLPRIAGEKGLEASRRQGSDRHQLFVGVGGDDQCLAVLGFGSIAAPGEEVVELCFGFEECRHAAERDERDEAEDHGTGKDYRPI
jgi:hypothetical protein